MAENNFIFDLSVSQERYANKCSDWGKVKYRTLKLDIDGLANYIREGYCFTHTFTKIGGDGYFTCNDKTIANFNHTNTIFIDVDDSNKNAIEFYNTVSPQPTILYTTPSNVTDIKNRFRLVYVFESAICSNEEYKQQVAKIAGSIKERIGDFTFDYTSINCSQQMGGNGKADCLILRNNRIFSFDDFEKWDNCIPSAYKKEKKNDITHRNADLKKEEKEVEIKDQQFIDEFFSIDSRESATGFLQKYQEKYPIYERTQINPDVPYIDLNDSNYIEISRRYYVIKDEYGINHSMPVKIKEGNRERILFSNALLRLRMNPTMPFENLLYAMVYERQIWLDNSDGEFTNYILYKIAKGAYLKRDTYNISNATAGQRRRRAKTNKLGKKVNKAFCKKYNISVRSMANRMRTATANDVLLKHYDFGKTIKENSKLLKEKGIKPNSERRLSEFVKWNKQNLISNNKIENHEKI